MPLKEELKEIYPYRIELHCHTKPSSPCGDFSVFETLDMYKAEKYDGVLLTNHYRVNERKKWDNDLDFFNFRFKDYEDGFEYGKKIGIKCYLGAELRFTENGCNDYLFIGANRKLLQDIFPYLKGSAEEFYGLYKPENSLFVQAHPYREKCNITDAKYLDGIEILNGHPRHNNANAFAARYAKQHPDLLKVCGTDFHHENMHALTAMRFKTLPDDSFGIADLIKKKEYIMEFGDNIILP